MREFNAPASFVVGEQDNVVSAVYENAATHPDYPIYQRLIDGVWTNVSCAQAADQIRSVARGLIARGVAPGDRVALLSATRYEWAILDLAILSVGALTVPIYETSSSDQIQWVLEDSGAVLLLAETDEHREMAEKLAPGLPALRAILQIEGSGPSAIETLTVDGADVEPAEVQRRVSGLRASDPATMIYTSGTTGRPKGCQLTHSNLIYEIRGAKDAVPDLLKQSQRLLVFLPLAHVLARAIAMAAMHNRVTVGFTSDIKNLIPMFAVFKPTIVVSVPRVFEKVYNTAEQNAFNAGKGKIFHIAADTAIAWSEALDRRRAAGRPVVPLLPRRRADHLRGLRTDRDVCGHHGEPDERHAGGHRRQAAGRQQHAHRRRRRGAGPRRRSVPRLLAEREGHRRRRARRLVLHR